MAPLKMDNNIDDVKNAKKKLKQNKTNWNGLTFWDSIWQMTERN